MPTHPSPVRLAARPTRRRPRRNKLSLPRRRPLRAATLEAFARVIAVARRSARQIAADPLASLHDYRKAIRRARAVIALLRPALGGPAAAGIVEELRRAFRETGPLRDAAILLSTLQPIPSEDPARGAIEQALAAEQEGHADPARAAECLRAGVRILGPLPATLRVTLPRAFSLADLERGLTRGCRRAHRTLARAVASGLETDFHEWRKRVKELRYQVELLASTGSSELQEREKALASLAEELGRVTDLIVLAAELERRRQNGSIPEAPALLEDIHRSIRARSHELLAKGQRIFADAPRDFARQVLAERG